MRFVMLDRIESLEVGKSLTAVKCWTLSEDVFEHHFPDYPVVPGTMLTESLVQSIGILAEESWPSAFGSPGQRVWSVLSMIRKAKFRRPVIPGDQVKCRATLVKLNRDHAEGKAQAIVDGDIRAEAEVVLTLFDSAGLAGDELKRRRNSHQDWLLRRWREYGGQ